MGNAPEILHHVPPAKFPRDEGFADEIMWHRAIPCGTQLEGSGVEEDDDGPWDYVFFYAARHSCPEHWVVCFEILDIRGSTDIAPKIADIS
jgi:hypothetical protein